MSISSVKVSMSEQTNVFKSSSEYLGKKHQVSTIGSLQHEVRLKRRRVDDFFYFIYLFR